MPRSLALVSLLVALSFPGIGSAQAGWTMENIVVPTDVSPVRAVAYSPQRDALLVVSAYASGGVYQARLREFVNGAWSSLVSQQVSSNYPPDCNATTSSVAAYWDPITSDYVICGAQNYNFSGNVTSLLRWSPSTGFTVSAWGGHASAATAAAFYDVVGSKGVVVHTDGRVTEILSNGQFQVVDPAAVPTPSPHDSFRGSCIDSARRRIIALAGGMSPSLCEYDIARGTWNQLIEMPAAFGPRAGCTVGFDPVRRVVVLYGGYPYSFASQSQGVVYLPPRSDVWLYDGAQAFQTSAGPGPVPRGLACFVWNTVRSHQWLLGGTSAQAYSSYPGAYYLGACSGVLRDAWSYVPGQAGVDYTFFGNGCPGSAGTPYLELLPNTLPYAGRPFSVMVKNAPLFAPVFMMLGASDSVWYGNGLPFQLAPFGAPLCSLLTGPDVVHPATNVFGTALWTATLPAGLAGATVFNQAVIFDPPANALGITLSNGGRALVGR